MMNTNTDQSVCTRESCYRKISPTRHSTTCSLLCEAVKMEMVKTERLCTTPCGDGDHWAAVVELNDALTAFKRSEARLFNIARREGTTLDEWRAMQRGDYATDSRRPGPSAVVLNPRG
jgi:hypothetical protein